MFARLSSLASRKSAGWLAHKASELGWPTDRVVVIDEDLGLTGSGAVARSGFARLTAEVALGHLGLVLARFVGQFERSAPWRRAR